MSRPLRYFHPALLLVGAISLAGCVGTIYDHTYSYRRNYFKPPQEDKKEASADTILGALEKKGGPAGADANALLPPPDAGALAPGGLPAPGADAAAPAPAGMAAPPGIPAPAAPGAPAGVPPPAGAPPGPAVPPPAK